TTPTFRRRPRAPAGCGSAWRRDLRRGARRAADNHATTHPTGSWELPSRSLEKHPRAQAVHSFSPRPIRRFLPGSSTLTFVQYTSTQSRNNRATRIAPRTESLGGQSTPFFCSIALTARKAVDRHVCTRTECSD